MHVVDVSEDLVRRLQALTRAVSPEEIGEVWIFPPLSDVEESAEFVLFTRRLKQDRRRVYSARVAPGRGDGRTAAGNGTAGNGAGGAASDGASPARNGGSGEDASGQVVTEHGSVPSGRVHRLVDRFRRRLEDEGEPLHVVIEGRRERWTRFLAEN